MRKIDWNQASQLGIIEKINTELLHPFGLSILLNSETGFSEGLVVSVEDVDDIID